VAAHVDVCAAEEDEQAGGGAEQKAHEGAVVALADGAAHVRAVVVHYLVKKQGAMGWVDSYIYTHTYIYIYIYVYTHTYIYIYIYIK